MVLEEASTLDSTFSSPTAPSSDLDQYAGDRDPTILSTKSPSAYPITRPGNASPLYINFSQLPMPWFPFGEAQSDAIAQKQMGDTLQKASDDYYKVAGRPFDQQEGDALVYHLAKALRLASFGPPLGVLTAGMVAYRPQAMKTFKFPGWTPGEKFNPEKFFMLKGGLARAAWHLLRFNAYGVLGLLAGEVLMGSYAMTVANVGRLQDPRLKNVNETLKKLQKERMEAKGLPIENKTEGKRGQESFEMARQRTRAQSSGSRGGGEDDMSPTGGSFREDIEGSQSGGDLGMLSDSQIQQLQQTEQRNEEATYQAQSSASAASAQRSSSRPPSSSLPQAQSSQSSSNSGSAWERLRQQAGQQQPSSSSPQQSSRGGQRSINDDDDAFGLGGSSESRNTIRPAAPSQSQNASPSRSDAQREFDAQLDRERQGEGNTKW